MQHAAARTHLSLGAGHLRTLLRHVKTADCKLRNRCFDRRGQKRGGAEGKVKHGGKKKRMEKEKDIASPQRAKEEKVKTTTCCAAKFNSSSTSALPDFLTFPVLASRAYY